MEVEKPAGNPAGKPAGNPAGNPAELEPALAPAPVTTTFDDFKEVPYNDNEFNQLFKEMVEDNENLTLKPEGLMNRFSAKKPIIIKPTDQTARMILFNLLRRIKLAASKKEDNTDRIVVSPELKKSLTSTFFLSLLNLKKNAEKNNSPLNIETFKNQIKNESISKFYKKLEEFGASLARFLPIISTLQEYYIGKHTLSFDEKSITEDVIKKQIEDAQKGIDNQFSLMSAFIGTKSQKVAARTSVIAGAATGLWALVAKLQQNPQTAGILMGVVAAAGPQAVFAGAIFAAVAVGYYAFLKVQDKYAKYFMLIRTMNEFIIVLNKVDRLVRLSYFISDKYSFDVNLKEIEAQLKVIFKRFDGMLNDDDRSKIEKDLETNLTPSVADAASNVVIENAGRLANQSSQTGEQTGQVGGGFLAIMGFDEEKWNKMLNDDVVKLNIYFTTSMTEFNMILNVIQMTQLTDDGKPAPAATAGPAAPATGIDKIKATTREIKSSTEYHKMVIGILLNDILKLRVDYSFCSRGGGIGGMTKTNDELVCLENTGSDPAGNKMSLFRKNLHEQMKHLVSVLNNQNTPYPPEIKSEILKEVVEPYKIMVINSQRINGSLQDVIKRFFLTSGAIIFQQNSNDLATFIQKEFPSTSLNPTTKGGSSNHSKNGSNQIGGGFFDRFRNTKPSPERDGQIIPFLKTHPYELVSDQSLTEFLARVNKFVKSVGTPTAEEQKKAQEAAKEIANDTANVLVNDAAKALPEAMQKAVQNLVKTTTPGGTPGGRRRFTRRRNRKNYSNTRGRKQSRRTM